MIVDWHAHIYTPEEAADDKGAWDGKGGARWGERGCPMVLENFLKAHHENGIDISVVTNAAHYLQGKRADEELDAVKKWKFKPAMKDGKPVNTKVLVTVTFSLKSL